MDLYKMKIGEAIIDYEIYSNYESLLSNIDSLEYKTCFIVYDSNIMSNVIDKIYDYFVGDSKIKFIPFEINEKDKDLSGLSRLLEQLVDARVTRSDCIVAFGGGVLGNMAGLAAGMLFRGIDFIHIPTTILACSDSVLSLKQGINLLKSKNIIGMYYAPVKIMIAPKLYNSLPRREISSGYAEYVKNLITIIPEDIEEFEVLDFDKSIQYESICYLVRKSIEAKMRLLSNDSHERREGILLEYGHTVGHSLEMMFPDSLRHGEGVSFGIMVAGMISREMGYFSENELKVQKELLEKIGMIDNLKIVFKDKKIDDKILTRCLLNDNKRGYIDCNNNEIAMVILAKFGKPLVTDELPLVSVPLELVMRCFNFVWDEINKQKNEGNN